MLNNNHHLQQLEDWIRLVKKGDPTSLMELRNQLGKTSREIADKLGVSEQQLCCWERGEQQPSGILHASWKLALSDYVDEEISTLINTGNPELVTHFWEILWRLND
jgi:DNA-binding XRE family transcriptional regulator